MLQRNNEIRVIVNAKKYVDWAISSQAPNRRRFNDYSIWKYVASVGNGNGRHPITDEDIVYTCKRFARKFSATFLVRKSYII